MPFVGGLDPQPGREELHDAPPISAPALLVETSGFAVGLQQNPQAFAKAIVSKIREARRFPGLREREVLPELDLTHLATPRP